MNDPTPNTSNVIPMHVNVVQADPITSMDQFAMLVDDWHARCMQQGNSVVELGTPGIVISYEDEKNPGEIIQYELDEITAQIFRLGAMTALNVFKDLPFGASLEDAPEDDAAG